MSPRGVVSRKRAVPTGSAPSRSDGIGTVGTDEAVGAGVAAVVTDAETRATNLPEGAQRSSILIRGPCVRKSQYSAEVKGSPPKTALSVRGTSPPKTALSVRGTSTPKPTPGLGGSVQTSSPYEVYTATNSIRSKTLRRMKVWGEPVSRSATHLHGVSSAMHCKFGGTRNVV